MKGSCWAFFPPRELIAFAELHDVPLPRTDAGSADPPPAVADPPPAVAHAAGPSRGLAAET